MGALHPPNLSLISPRFGGGSGLKLGKAGAVRYGRTVYLPSLRRGERIETSISAKALNSAALSPLASAGGAD